MAVPRGVFKLGPESARLTVRTGKTGTASKAGHNLEIEVATWSATLQLGDSPADSALSLTADSGSLRVIAGGGGVMPLGEDDKGNIGQTIADEVLKGGTIEFESTTVEPLADHQLHIEGQLQLMSAKRPLAFDLTLDDSGQFDGEATVKQTDWGIKPYSALFGALKVADEVKITVDGRLPRA